MEEQEEANNGRSATVAFSQWRDVRREETQTVDERELCRGMQTEAGRQQSRNRVG